MLTTTLKIFRNPLTYLLRYLKRSAFFLILFSSVLLLFELFIPVIFTLVTRGGSYDGRNLLHVSFYLACTILFFLIIPLLSNKFFYKARLAELGFQKPKNKIKTLTYMLLVLLFAVPMILWLTHWPVFKSYYALNQLSHPILFLVILTVLPIYYFCEEFFFRGFLFLNLSKKIGWHSYWVTDILFVLGHTGKPFLEIIIAFPVGILLAWLTLRTKSIYPSMIVHYMLGVTMLLVVNHVV